KPDSRRKNGSPLKAQSRCTRIRRELARISRATPTPPHCTRRNQGLTKPRMQTAIPRQDQGLSEAAAGSGERETGPRAHTIAGRVESLPLRIPRVRLVPPLAKP